MTKTKAKVKPSEDNSARVEELEELIQDSETSMNSALEALNEAKEEYEAACKNHAALCDEHAKLCPKKKDTAITDFIAARRKAFDKRFKAATTEEKPSEVDSDKK
jgi:O-methyltransferase involved in polyketide biosynthesis